MNTIEQFLVFDWKIQLAMIAVGYSILFILLYLTGLIIKKIQDKKEKKKND